jgi:2,5-dioxopentanoate dehydrogenase
VGRGTRVSQLIGGSWTSGNDGSSKNPIDGEIVATAPSVEWAGLDEALDHGVLAYEEIQDLGPESMARFLEALALAIEGSAEELVDAATRETALPPAPRLKDVELPRTTDQLRQAAHAARARSWARPTIETAENVRSMLTPLPGPVVTIGPSNFPLAFNSVVGGDAAAALATGHPIVAKAHPGHLLTSYLLAELAHESALACGLPESAIQVVYLVDPPDGLRLVADPRVAATAFTGSRPSGMALKAAANSAGVPIYLEMSSANPVVVLERAAGQSPVKIAGELVESLTLGAGQFCTKPGLIFLVESEGSRRVVEEVEKLVGEHPGGIMTSDHLISSFQEALQRLMASGAEVRATGSAPPGHAAVSAGVLRIEGERFVEEPQALQEEAFGPASLLVVCEDFHEMIEALTKVEGSLAAAIYASEQDGEQAAAVLGVLTSRVGRVVFNRPTTGVKVVSAMNHGGPFPSTGHPGFTAVGIPRSLERFGKLTSFDGLPDGLLPLELQDANPLGIWREVDGAHTRQPLGLR